jgi:hypothetical protein
MVKKKEALDKRWLWVWNAEKSQNIIMIQCMEMARHTCVMGVKNVAL